MMNARYGELVNEGHSPESALAKMEKDYNNMTKYHEAQEYAASEAKKALERINSKGSINSDTKTVEKVMNGAKQPTFVPTKSGQEM